MAADGDLTDGNCMSLVTGVRSPQTMRQGKGDRSRMKECLLAYVCCLSGHSEPTESAYLTG